MRSIDFNLLPPFVAFLVFEAAAIVTQRLLKDNKASEDLKRLRILRKFLQVVGKRWLSCGEWNKTVKKSVELTKPICVERYLKILNEDTTPRLLKILEQG